MEILLIVEMNNAFLRTYKYIFLVISVDIFKTTQHLPRHLREPRDPVRALACIPDYPQPLAAHKPNISIPILMQIPQLHLPKDRRQKTGRDKPLRHRIEFISPARSGKHDPVVDRKNKIVEIGWQPVLAGKKPGVKTPKPRLELQPVNTPVRMRSPDDIIVVQREIAVRLIITLRITPITKTSRREIEHLQP